MKKLLSVLVTISLLFCCGGETVKADSNIPAVSVDGISAMKVPDSSTDAGLSESWYIDSIGCKDMWQALDNRDMLPGQGVVIAVIDTGLAAGTPALDNARWCNEAELNGEEDVDDDGNGYIDDIYGLNLANSYYTMSDNNGHGTEVAGIIGMQPDDDGGVGIAYGARIMPIKVSTDTNFAEEDIIEAIHYAVNMGADIINMSFATYRYSDKLYNAVKEASESCVMVAAAGNEKYVTEGVLTESDLKAGGYGYGDAYPASWDCCIGVMSCGQSDELASFSNWDQNSDPRKYDIIAPGDHIYTVTRANRYVSVSGTSYSTSIVSASVAVLKSITDDDMSADELRELFLSMMEDRVSFTYGDVEYEFPKLSFSGMLQYLAERDGNSGENDVNNDNGDSSENGGTNSGSGSEDAADDGAENGGAGSDGAGSGGEDNNGSAGMSEEDNGNDIVHDDGGSSQGGNSGKTDMGASDTVTDIPLETQPIIEEPGETSDGGQVSQADDIVSKNTSKPRLGKVTQNKKNLTIKIKNYTKKESLKIKLIQTVKKKGKKSEKTCSFAVRKNKIVISKKKLKKKGFRKGNIKIRLVYKVAGRKLTTEKKVKLK